MRSVLVLLSLTMTLCYAHYTYQIAVCAMFQDEALYLKEWLEFHMLIGVEHFYLYNNVSTDDYETVLSSYIEQGKVTLIDWPYVSHSNWDVIQRNAYNDALARTRGRVKWLAFIDLDEFIMPLEHDNLGDILQDYECFGGVCAHWQLFGTSHVRRIRKGKLLLESLLWRAPEVYEAHYRVKSIVQPEHVSSCKNQHVFYYEEPYFHVLPNYHRFDSVPSEICCEKIQINHYWTRDIWYFIQYKLPRRRRYNNGLDIIKRARELNRVKDTSALRFVPALRRILLQK